MNRLNEILKRNEGVIKEKNRLNEILERDNIQGSSNTKEGFFQRVVNLFTEKPTKNNRSFPYIFNGEKREVKTYVPFQLHDFSYISAFSRSKGLKKKGIRNLIYDSKQKKILNPLIKSIKKETYGRENQARVAISLTQNIPYEQRSIISKKAGRNKTPYEVVRKNKGVCGGKSLLLSFLLKELGIGNVIFHYDYLDKDPISGKSGRFNHANVGVKCDKEFDYEGTGYAVIETNHPSIISDYSWRGYRTRDRKPWGRRIPKKFDLIEIYDGKKLNISQEYFDAQEVMRLRTIAEYNGGRLKEEDNKKLAEINRKYGIS